MKKHELSEVAIKLIGLYGFILFAKEIINLPMIYSFFLWNPDTSISNIMTPVFASIITLALLFISYIFVKRTDLILKLLDLSPQHDEEEKPIEVATWCQISFWILILGLYFFVSSAPYVASHLIVSILSLDLSTQQQVHVVNDSGQYILSQVFMLGLSLYFIFKNQYIESILTRTKSEEK